MIKSLGLLAIAGMALLATSAARVTIIGDIQVFNVELPQCLAAYPTKAQHCSVANPNGLKPGQEASEKAAAVAAKDVYVDPTSWLCTSERCSSVIGNFIAYWNFAHISVPYSLYLTDVLQSALKSTLQGLGTAPASTPG